MAHAVSRWLFLSIVAVMTLLTARQTAGAEHFFSFGVRQVYEDNVIGLVSDNPNNGLTGENGAAVAVVDDGSGQNRTPPIVRRDPVNGGGSGGSGGGGDDTGGGTLDDRLTTTTSPTGTAGAATVQTKGDFSTDVRVDAGISHDLNKDASLLLQAGAGHTAYRTFSQFDYTTADLQGGVATYFADGLSSKILLEGAIKKFQNSLRDSTAYGFSLSLKKRFTSLFWVRGTYRYERNDADSPFYTYQGNSFGLRSGYAVTENSSLGLGYRYLTRNFTEPPPVKVASHTVSFDWTWYFHSRWSLDAGYGLERADSTIPGAATTNNIFSVGLTFDY